jgi:hypothetical protein
VTRRESDRAVPPPRSQFPLLIRDAALCLAESGIPLADWVQMRETLIGALIFLPDARAMVEAVDAAGKMRRAK